MSIKDRRKLGEMLVKANIITQEQRDKALLEQRKTYERIGKVLIKMWLCF